MNGFEYLSLIISILAGGGIISFILHSCKVKRDNEKLIKQTLTDLYRHSWRNTVILESLKILSFREENSNKKPSYVHIAKLKGLDYAHSALFNVNTFSSVEKYSYFHELQLKIRNFHIEVDVVVDYLKSKSYQKVYFDDYLDALIWKQSYLVSEIGRINKLIFPKENISDSYKYMMDNIHKNPQKEPNVYEKYRSEMISDIRSEIDSAEEDIELTVSSKKIFFIPIE